MANEPLHEIVRAERGRRALQVSEAAIHGGVSSELWRRYEHGAPLTPKMQKAVALAFEWPLSWPERPPTPEAPMDRLDILDAKVDQIVLQLHELVLAVQALANAAHR